jgi:zona occludens toxin
MIYLITGTPGAGKTSNTLWDFLKDPDFSDRPKFATFIPDFDYDTQNVTELDKTELEDWRNLPKGALVLIDEADGYLPAGNGKNPPDWIREFARHRHYGIDFIIITQMASMINDFLHGLIEAHIHYHRVRGNDYSTKYRWEFLQKNPYTKTNKALGLPQKIKTNPEVFKMYRSTVMNTRRKEFPWHAVIKMALLCSGLLLAAVFVYWYMLGRHQVDEPVKKPSLVPVASVAPAVSSTATPTSDPLAVPSESESFTDRPLTYKDFIPDNPLMPYTAPAYTELARPTDFPRIAACMDSVKTGCKCFTQQYTPVDVPKDSCLRMVKEGWFDNFATGRSQQDQVLQGKSDEVSKRNSDRAKNQVSQTEA